MAKKMSVKTKKLVDALGRVKRRLQKGWTFNAFARDKNGKKVAAKDPRAVRWCLDGAFLREGLSTSYLKRPYADLYKAVGGSPVDFNDSKRSSRPVIEKIDRAIASAKAA